MNVNVAGTTLKRGTNIISIEVPPALMERYPLGGNLKWLDEALGGPGFTPSKVDMLTGDPGCGKTTLLQQMADAITRAGNAVLYNTGEESQFQVAAAAKRLGLNAGFIIGTDRLVKDSIAHAEEIRAKNPKRQLFLLQDSLQTLDDGKYADGGITSNTAVRACEMLTSWAKTPWRLPGSPARKKNKEGIEKLDEFDTFPIVIFIGQVTKDGKFAGKNTIKHAVDGHVELTFDTDKKSETFGERLLQVSKNRFGPSGMETVVGLGAKGLTLKGTFSRD